MILDSVILSLPGSQQYASVGLLDCIWQPSGAKLGLSLVQHSMSMPLPAKKNDVYLLTKTVWSLHNPLPAESSGLAFQLSTSVWFDWQRLWQITGTSFSHPLLPNPLTWKCRVLNLRTSAYKTEALLDRPGPFPNFCWAESGKMGRDSTAASFFPICHALDPLWRKWDGSLMKSKVIMCFQTADFNQGVCSIFFDPQLLCICS